MYLLFIAFILLFILVARKVIRLAIWRHKCSQLMPSTKPSFFNPLGDIRHLISLDRHTVHFKFFKLLKLNFEKFKENPLVCLWLFYEPVVMAIKVDAVKEILKGMRTNEKSWVYDFFKPIFGTGLLTSGGKKWKSRRKLLTHCFHNDILRDFQAVFNEHCQKLAELFQGETNKEFTCIDNYIKLSSLDMICETMFGVTVKALENEDSHYVKAGLKLGKIFMARVYNFWLWPDFIFRRTKTGKEFFNHLKIFQDFTRSVIQEKKAQYLQNGEVSGKRKRKALMDMLLERHMKFHDMTEEDVREEVDTFIMEGHDTIAISIIWTLFLIGHHPDVQAKLHEELDRTLGKDVGMPVSVDDLNNLDYMECVIKESNRIYTVVPIHGRQVYQDINICGYTVPKGSSFLVLSYYLHRDESVFPDPERFDPDRFSPENAVNIPKYGFIPFSAGSRDCIGKVFAMLEMKTILCYILRRFVLKSLDGRDKVLPVMHVTLNNSIPIRIRFRCRQEDKLAEKMSTHSILLSVIQHSSSEFTSKDI